MAAAYRSLLLACLFLCTCAPALRADPIEVTSGVMHIAWDDPSAFQFSAEGGFSLSGLFLRVASSPQQVCFLGCLPGATINLSSTVGGGSGFGLGTATSANVNGVVYVPHPAGAVSLAGDFLFTAGDVVLPPMTGEPFGRVGVTAPFVFEGRVAGFASGVDISGIPLFDVMLRGQGTAELNVSRSPDGVYRFPEVTYTFAASPDPIPEPATLILLGSGMAMLGARRVRRRCRS